MKSFFTLLIVVLACYTLTAQEGIVPDDLLIENRWYDGETRSIFEHPTTQVYGQRIDTRAMQNVGELTNIGYFSLSQVLENIGAKWKMQNIDSADANKAADSLKKVAPGGYVYLYIERFLENRANLQYFFIIVRDKDDKTVYTKNFEYKAPSIASIRSTWWNYVVTEIPVEINYPFYIYVNDNQTGTLSDFKFKIDDNVMVVDEVIPDNGDLIQQK